MTRYRPSLKNKKRAQIQHQMKQMNSRRNRTAHRWSRISRAFLRNGPKLSRSTATMASTLSSTIVASMLAAWQSLARVAICAIISASIRISDLISVTFAIRTSHSLAIWAGITSMCTRWREKRPRLVTRHSSWSRKLTSMVFQKIKIAHKFEL